MSNRSYNEARRDIEIFKRCDRLGVNSNLGNGLTASEKIELVKLLDTKAKEKRAKERVASNDHHISSSLSRLNQGFDLPSRNEGAHKAWNEIDKLGLQRDILLNKLLK